MSEVHNMTTFAIYYTCSKATFLRNAILFCEQAGQVQLLSTESDALFTVKTEPFVTRFVESCLLSVGNTIIIIM